MLVALGLGAGLTVSDLANACVPFGGGAYAGA